MPDDIRPNRASDFDREIEIHHELDGPLQGFGDRLWSHITSDHSASKTLLDRKECDVVSLIYRDRYLFTPMSIALLAEVVGGLRNAVGHDLWSIEKFEIVTTNRRLAGENRTRNTVWADWHDANVRDQVVQATFDYIGMGTLISAGDGGTTGHGRLLEVGFASGKKLTLRLDQGVSYWRSSPSNSRQASYFDLNTGDPELQGAYLAKLELHIEGSQLPTQLFLKVR